MPNLRDSSCLLRGSSGNLQLIRDTKEHEEDAKKHEETRSFLINRIPIFANTNNSFNETVSILINDHLSFSHHLILLPEIT